MKAILIDPAAQTTEIVDVSNTADIAALIGFDTLESDELGDGDSLFFDEECFIRGDAVKGRFKIDHLVPVAGKGVVAGLDEETGALQDVHTSVEDIASRIQYL